jgi:hypothetical protein
MSGAAATCTTIGVAMPPAMAGRWPIADRNYAWLVAAIVAGLALRLHCLINPYLWLDEYVTLWSIGGGSYRQMLDRASEWTASGPLFVLCYRASCDLTGNIDIGLKLPGVIAGTIAIWVAWWSALRLFGRMDVALVAAWFVALAPQFIHFSQEARPYMVASLLVLASIGSLANWINWGRRGDLAAVVTLSVAAVGFHLLCALALVAQNIIVLCMGLGRRWQRARWLEWGVGQLAAAGGLWIAGAQFRSLSGRHGSMLLDTVLPMPTRMSLDEGLWGQFQVEMAIVLIVVGFWWCARRFPATDLGRAWTENRMAVCLAAVSYCVPTGLLTLLSVMRIIDPWPRYYFLFHSGVMLAFAWLVAGVFPKPASRLLLAIVLAGSVVQYNFTNGVLSCRLNLAWLDFGTAERELQSRFGPDDLVLSRSGLIESNHLTFLNNSVGASYLKSFCEARTGGIEAQHFPLPFSVETQSAEAYLEQIFSQHVLTRHDFWLANIGTSDFDYSEWIASRYGETLRKTEEIVYPMITLTHYENAAM